jgi:hypothetical protein
MTRKQLTLIVGFLMLLSFLAGNLLNRNVLAEPVPNLQASQPVNTGTQKWEYKYILSFQETGNNLEATMNRWGDQGFDLAEFQVTLNENPSEPREYKHILMKRPKK